MLIEFTPPADTLDGRALRALNLAAAHLFGENADGWLQRVELPKDPPMAPHRARSSATSRNAAQLVAPKAGSQAREVLAILRGYPRPMTAAHVTDELRRTRGIFAPTRNQVAARLWSLRNGGWVEYVPSDEPGEEFATASTGGEYRGRVQRLTVKAIRMFEAEIDREATQ